MKNILFVDDIRDVLLALQLVMRSKRREWDMVFANSGAEALRAMAEKPFDVLVTDMQMPGMSGTELLLQVQARYPQTARIVLSGDAGAEASMRAVFVSHQFLTKPCHPKTLMSVIDRACGVQELLRHRSLRVALGAVAEFPVLPRVYKVLTVALAKEEVDVREVGGIVEEDAGVAAKILQLINSSFFGIRTEITDLRRAVAYLGTNTIRDLVLTFAMFREFEGSVKLPSFSMEREHSHSLLTARIARRLLDGKEEAEQAFQAALLHDAGKLVLATRLPEPFLTVLQAGAGVERPFHRVEEETLGVGHAEIGAYLLGLWGLPYPVVEAVAHHHHPARVPNQTSFGVLGATHVADYLAREQDGCKPETFELDEQYLQALGVAEKLPEWRAVAAEEADAESEAA